MTREEQINEKVRELAQTCFPDEGNIWARENYEAQKVEWACKQMVEWADKTIIDKACDWLLKGGYFVNNTETINDFKRAMEE